MNPTMKNFLKWAKAQFDKECKICTRPFTVFRWRDARYKKTEVCQTCSKLKNVCQVCLLDLEYGLPDQVRDTALGINTSDSIPKSDVKREFFAEEQDRKGMLKYDLCGLAQIEYRSTLQEQRLASTRLVAIFEAFSDTPDLTAMAEARQTRSKTSAARTSEPGAGAEATKKKLPKSENPLVIRTDFSDQATWEAIMKAIRTPTPEGFAAYVEFVDDPAFRGLTSAQLLDMVSEYKAQHSFLMIVDERTIAEPEHPLVVVNLSEDEADGDDGDDEAEPQYGREFRAVPSAIQAVENNLSIANMGFEDFADAVDKDGVLQEFRDEAESNGPMED